MTAAPRPRTPSFAGPIESNAEMTGARSASPYRSRPRRGAALIGFAPPVLAVLLLLAGSASAATTVRAFVAAKNAVAVGPGHTGTSVTPVSHGLLKVTATIALDKRAGTGLAGTPGVAGSTVKLANCAVGVCNDSFRGAGLPRLVIGHFAEWVQVSLAQPRATGVQFGFALELAVQLASGWVFADGYFASGTTSATTPQTIHLNLVLDLGTTSAPTVLGFRVVLYGCGSTAQCP